VGKSRLLYEFRQRIDRGTTTVLEGRCQSYGAETPYLPLLDALRRGLRIHELTDSAVLHDTAVVNIRAISPDLEQYLPHLLHLLSIPSTDHPLPDTLQGEALRRELEAALAATITLNTGHRPMVLVYEDWHWADAASDAVLNNLVGLIGHYPLLLVVLYRPEYQRKWGDVEHSDSIVLHALEMAQTGHMLASVLASDELPDGLARAVHDRTGGNALFNEELAHALRDEGMVAVIDGSLTLTRPVEELALPETVHAVIRARVDRLDPADREILRLASVIGREFDRAVLERIAPNAELAGTALVRLARQDLVHQTRVVPRAEYLFKHVLTQVVVYDTLLLQQRKALHARVGQAIESLYADRLEDHYERLAKHYSQTDQTEQAVDYLGKAGDKAAGYYSLVEAREHFRDALRLLDGLDLPPDGQRTRIDLSLKWARASQYGATDEHVSVLDTSLEFAHCLQDKSRTARVTGWMGRMRYIQGKMNQAITLARRSLKLAEEIGDEVMVSFSANLIGRASTVTQERAKSYEYSERGIDLAERLGDWEEVAYTTYVIAIPHGYSGNFAKAYSLIDKSIEISRRIGNLTRESSANVGLTMIRCIQGDWDGAREAGQRCVRIARESGNAWVEGIGMAQLSLARFYLGAGQEGLVAMRDAVDGLQAAGLFNSQTVLCAWLAECCAVTGMVDEGAFYLSKSMAFQESGETIGKTTALRAMGLLAAAQPTPDFRTATEHLGESFRLAEERAERPNPAVAHFRYAETLHREGDLVAAREQLDAADTLFRDMGMDWWTEQARGLRERIDRCEPFKWFAPYLDGPPQLTEQH
jgi:tetratricopeptide (TPR) repeat protein